LRKGFGIGPSSRNLLLLPGGIGIASLVFVAQRAGSQHSITLIHGAKMARELYPLSSLVALPHLRQRSNLSPLPTGVRFIPVTEDGSLGKKGVITHIVPDFLNWADQIYTCGPVDAYKAMADLTCHSEPSEESKLKKCQVSLEVRMACGVGAYYGCTIDTQSGLKQVCRDGPISELDGIIWKEVKI